MTDVLAWLDRRADEMAELLVRLVACETENPPGRYLADCAVLLGEAMDRLGLKPEILELTPTAALAEPRIVRGAAGDGARVVYFHGHFDVVPVQDRAQFRAVRRDGRITGRGTADMKGGIVSMLYGAAAAQELGLLDRGRIVIHLVCDEETGSAVGSGQLRERNLIDRNAVAMLTAEQSGEVIWNTARGALSLRVDVHGRAAHVGEAFKGVNSFLHMLRVAAALEAHVGEMSERGSMIVVGGRSGGGSNFNVVPERTWFTVDGRFNPEVDLDAEQARITAIVSDAARAAGAEVSVEVTQLAPPSDTSASHPAATLLGNCVAEVTGRSARFELCAGCLDTRWYAQLGIPSFGFGPGRFDVSHGPDEYVDEVAMRRVAAVYARYAAELLAAG
ncbi:MAG TPA: M20/M25/M40 family metallo-hydrolase [Jatrophihabitantaceae bacterium]|nr:M20/M25/M40 family metallo-hydrolase [Jatrophihabitantaceae bacterium]